MPQPNTGPENALDAINEALGIESAIEDEESTGGDADDDSDSDSDDAGDDTDGDESGTEEDSEGDEGADEEGDAELTEEEKVAKAKGAKSEFNEDGTRKEPPKRKSDPINDPIPKDLKKETSDRMRALVKIAKDRDVELTQVRGDFETIINGIKSTNSTPEQYGEAISWLGLFNSPDIESRKQAYELVNNVADRMATMLGIDRTTADPLAGHPDLVAAVKANPATAAMAKEIARNRNAANFQNQINTGQLTKQQQQEQAEREHAQAKTDLNTFDVEMREKDPLYDAKRKQIVPILQPLFKKLPKSQWAEAYKAAYAQAKVQPRGNSAVKPKQQPLRGGKQPAGGQSRQAGSALEAMNGALASMAK